MIVLLGAAAVVVAAVVGLALQPRWWILIVVVFAHAIATAAVLAYTWRRAGEGHDEPTPASEARLEEERAKAHRDLARSGAYHQRSR